MIIAYLRKSQTDIKGENLMETLAKHEERLDELAVHNGVNIEVYYREVVSGESLDARPEMRKLLDHLYSGEVTHLYVMEIERLGRGDSRDQGTIFQAIKYSNVKIVTPIKTYDINDPYDEEYLEFALFMSRREYKTITRRMQSAKIQFIKSGNYIAGYAPFGYDVYKPDRKIRTLKPNEQSIYVKMIFDWFVNDRLAIGEIARKLTTMGIPTQRNKPQWGNTTVRQILKNPVYMGKIQWFKRQNTKVYEDGGYKNVLTQSENAILIDGKHEAIISPEQYARAQTLFVSAPMKSKETMNNVLSGLLKCAKCGRAIIRFPSKKCQTRFVHAKNTKCTVKSAYYDDVVLAVLRGLENSISDFEFKMTNEAALQAQIAKQREIDTLKNELKLKLEQRNDLFQLLEEKIYSPAEFTERRAIITARIKEIENLLENTVVEIKEYHEEIVKFSQVLKSLKDDDIPVKHKNELLKDIIKRIDYSNECGKITLDIIYR